jgi:hypothetical protein
MKNQLISEWLLKAKIKELEENNKTTGRDEFYYVMCKRELEIIKRLNIQIDMFGEDDEFYNRLSDETLDVYFTPTPKRYEIEKSQELYRYLEGFVHEMDAIKRSE